MQRGAAISPPEQQQGPIIRFLQKIPPLRRSGLPCARWSRKASALIAPDLCFTFPVTVCAPGPSMARLGSDRRRPRVRIHVRLTAQKAFLGTPFASLPPFASLLLLRPNGPRRSFLLCRAAGGGQSLLACHRMGECASGVWHKPQGRDTQVHLGFKCWDSVDSSMVCLALGGLK
jgi:hypothetical protein